MKSDTVERLVVEFESFPVLRAQEGATAEEIVAATEAIGIPFPLDYVEFVQRFGGAIVGPYPIYGVRPVETMGNRWSIVDVNRDFRSNGWAGIDSWLIFSSDHAGNPIGLCADGKVRVVDHDFGEVLQLANDFEDFLRHNCLKL